MKFSWNQPICERCWIERDGNWTEDGIRIPVRLSADQVKVCRCSYCGHPTFVGIFIRDDPDYVPYPCAEEDE